MAGYASVVALVLCAVAAVVCVEPVIYANRVGGGNGGRIVSGWEAERGQFPYQLSLRMVNGAGGVTACGASIIHNEWALTAAHCTAGRESFIIRAGTVNMTVPSVIFETTEFYNYPTYDNSIGSIVQPDDIGLLKFNRFLPYSELIQPIRLQRSADMNRDYSYQRLTASGWGMTWTQGSSPENLNWVYLLGDSNFQCWIMYGGSSIIQDSTICASAYNVSSQSTCSGDSGGPLTVVEDDGIPTLVGVTSFVSGTGCHTNFPAGFVRPGHYHDWYKKVTGINFDWEPSDAGSGENNSESSKDSSESGKDSLESGKDSSESGKDSSDSGEDSSESAEDSSESGKDSSESGKDSSESGKDSSDSGEDSSESAEDSSESGKDSSESGKDSSESGKDSSESGKDSSESNKDSSESGKESSESGKDSSESGKDSSDSGEDSSESAEDSSESGKDSSESGKDSLESDEDNSEERAIKSS